jgi:CRP-like cAMP-binding protein/CheY-like chemotaxis protein
MTSIQEISEFELFQSLPDKTLEMIAGLMKAKVFAPGEIVVQQGQTNSTLYFIRSGTADVTVNDELVTVLQDKGAVFGEISVFFSLPSSASVRACTELQCFLLDADYLETIDPKQRLSVELQLFKSYAAILSRRLVKTNEKAFRFEVANRSLMSAQNQLRKLNELIADMALKNVAELSQSAIRMIKRIQSVADQSFRPLVAQLGASGEADHHSLKALKGQLESVLNDIAPLEAYISEDAKVRHSRVLFIDPDLKQHTLARMALGGAGSELTSVRTAAEAIPYLKEHEFDLIFCNIEMADVVSQMKGENLVFMASTDVLENLTKIREESFFRNLITRDPEDRHFTVKNFLTTLGKVTTKNIFGIERYLAPGVDIFDELICGSGDRRLQIQKTIEHYREISIRSTTLDRVEVVLEEMLMNAIYDAPTDKNGKSLFNHLPRTQEVNLKEGQQAHLRHGCDGLYLAVSVVDPFGSLQKNTILNYLQSCYDGRAGTLDSKKGGAGRGLGMIIESADLVIFNVWPQHRTEVICLYDLEAMQKRRTVPPSFHLFFL